MHADRKWNFIVVIPFPQKPNKLYTSITIFLNISKRIWLTYNFLDKAETVLISVFREYV